MAGEYRKWRPGSVVPSSHGTRSDKHDIGKLLQPNTKDRVAQESKTLAVKAKSVQAIILLLVAPSSGVTHSTDPATNSLYDSITTQ
jgi:hypothetical protein